MTATNGVPGPSVLARDINIQGLLWFTVAVVGAGLLFETSIIALFEAWQTPEYSHGPLIPVLSLLLFLRQLKDWPVETGPVNDRWPGLIVMLLAVALGSFGRMIQIADFVAYSLILWTGGILLVSFGWRTGRNFWPPVLHLVYMLPLPGVLYYGLSTYLQGISAEIGVWLLQMLQVPVFLDGNIIDLGVYKLHVAEACSGLRYLFPILSFSYIFAVLYMGPMWHKAVLLISAVPITVFMNSVRIAIAGIIVDRWGLEHVEGFSHFFEGWVIFMSCVIILFGLAWLMLFLHPDRPSLADALDLDVNGLWPQAARLRLIQPSAALITSALVVLVVGIAWQGIPPRELYSVQRENFATFPSRLGDWEAGLPVQLDAQTERVLAANDYHSVTLTSPEAAAPVDLFMAWYRDQMKGGTHSPTVCLPGSGWEIAALETVDVSGEVPGAPFTLKRAVIQKGIERMLVYYWYDQQGVRTASSYYAKLLMTFSKARSGRADGALIRLITPIRSGESERTAERRLQEAMVDVVGPLPRFVPGK